MGGFFWFGVGVLTAWTYTHHKEMENRWGWGNGEHRHQCGSWSRSFEGRRAYPGGPSYRQEPYPDAPHPPAEKAPAGVPYQAQEAHPMMQQQHWEELQVLRRQAGERMTEMSEATIDSLVAGLQGLKARIAEHREQQERTAQRSPHDAQSPSPLASQQLGESRLV